ncbi:MAG: G-D-S-L family lipolytic protein [Sphingobacteriaceae bacterium]|nr:MAG: G-D-S-L family lipolytic protein [Sphingobacteriaceae bacterium]
MKSRYLFGVYAALILAVSACKKDKDSNKITSGTADFFRYIAVGNSITSGYANNGLYVAGQQVAFPNLLSGQMKLAGGGAFTSPLFSANQANGSGYLKLTALAADGTPTITPVTTNLAVRGQTTISGVNVTLFTKYTGDLNNYGVPGIKLANVSDPLYGNFNGFYERLLPGNAGSNSTAYLDFVTAKPFTFFSCWLGNNDVLGWATSSGTSATDALTPKADFTTFYTTAVAALTKNGAKGFVATVPDITVLPFFHTITVPALLAAAKKANPLVTALYIQALDASGNYITREATSNDLIMLTFNTAQLGTTVNGLPFYGILPINPLLSKEVLDATEVAKAQDYISSYNTSIKAIAATKNLPVFDSYALLNGLKTGVMQNGVTLNTNFISGGFFSLDGVHFTPRGNAYVTDEIIKVINAKYGSNLPALDISTYDAVKVMQ